MIFQPTRRIDQEYREYSGKLRNFIYHVLARTSPFERLFARFVGHEFSTSNIPIVIRGQRCTDIEPVQCCNAGGPAGAAGRCVGSWRLGPLSTANLSRLPQMLSPPQDIRRFCLPLRVRASSQEIISLTWNRRRRRRRGGQGRVSPGRPGLQGDLGARTRRGTFCNPFVP